MIAARLERRAVGVDLDYRLHAVERRIRADLDLLSRGAPHLRIVVAGRLELGKRELLVVQDHGGGVMAGNQRVELALVLRKLAVQIEGRLTRSEEHTSELQS